MKYTQRAKIDNGVTRNSVFSNLATQALIKAFAGNKLLLMAALFPFFLALITPMINVHIIYPAFTDIIVQGIEVDAKRLATHELPAALKHTRLTRESLTDRFFGQIYRLEHDFGLYKLRIFSSDGTIIYSTDTQEIGKNYSKWYFNDIVARGQSFTKLTTKEARPNTDEIGVIDVVETYVPFMKGDVFLGAFEMYYDISKRTARLNQLTFYSQIAMITLSVALIISLLVMLRAVSSKQLALDRADTLKDDVDRITRHDLKTPIIALSNGIEYLESFTELDDEQASMTSDMRQAAAKAMETINRSLDLYKMETGVYVFAPADMDLLYVVRRVSTDLSRLAMYKSISVKVLVGGSEPADSDTMMVKSEEALCYSLLANLLKNAIEASDSNDTITISLDHGTALTLSVHNPSSVPLEVRDTFFDKYTTCKKSGGTGLGTYSAHLLTKTMGGTITMETSDSDGTLITVTLPSQREQTND